MPSDLWVKVFQYIIQEKLECYLKEDRSNLGMRPPTFDLSQVCQNWRYIISTSPELYTLAYVAPSQVWRQDEYDLVVTSAKKASAPLTILTSISQQYCNGYESDRRYDQSGHYTSTISPNESTIFDGKEYNLLIDMEYDNAPWMSRVSNLPLRQPTGLVYSSRLRIRSSQIFKNLAHFSTVKSFSIINDNPSSFPNTPLSSSLPQLQRFTLHVKSFPSDMQLANFLASTLRELYLRNDAGGHLPRLDQIELPRTVGSE
jgi:hypothetical protein